MGCNVAPTGNLPLRLDTDQATLSRFAKLSSMPVVVQSE
jgi:hypothetical protein